MSNAPETPPPAQPAQIVPFIDNGETDLMWSSAGFDHAQRLAKLFASSVLVPEHLRGKVADVTIALLMARRLGEDPLVVMQNIHVIHGKAGWSAQYIVARANRSGVFRGRIGWRSAGAGEALEVTAFATLAETGEVVSFAVGMKMAKGEGWATNNKKYATMPELMLRYRSATFLVRLYAPEVMLGIPTADELDDIEPGPRAALPGGLGTLGLPGPVVEAEVVPPAAAPAEQEKPARKPRAPKAPTPAPEAPAPAEPTTPAQEALVQDVAAARHRRALLDGVQTGREQLGEEASASVVARLGLAHAIEAGGVANLTDEQLAALGKAMSLEVDAMLDLGGEMGS